MRRTLFLRMGAVLLGLLLVATLAGWTIYQRQKATLLWTLSLQSEQLQLALNERLDSARLHVLGMRQTAERSLRQPLLIDTLLPERLERRNQAPLRDAPWDRMPQDLTKAMGAVQVSPAAAASYRKDLSAVLSGVGQAVAAQGPQRGIVRSYFFGTPQQWRWVYPAQSRDDVLKVTAQADMGAALTVLWDSAGVTAATPARNPDMGSVWSSRRADALTQQAVMSVLVPVRDGDNLAGVMGADLALDALQSAMNQHPLTVGYAWVVDAQGQVLAQSAQDAPAPPNNAGNARSEVRQWALGSSPFSLWVHLPSATVAKQVWVQCMPALVIGIVGLLAVAATTLWLTYHYVIPAMHLAHYVQTAQGPHPKRPPAVPDFWTPWFKQVARAARSRHEAANPPRPS